MPRPTSNGMEALAMVAGIKPRGASSNFYEVLEVSKTASPDDIRKAYLKLSMKNHPDKNPGDEAAKRRFQQISEAYQVLSDPRLRSKYDATGSVDGIDFEDAAAVFTQLFGSPKFDVYIGRLRLASMILFEGDEEAFIAYEKQRLEDLILNLSIIVQQYTLSNDLDSFVFAMGEEAKVLAKEQHGTRLLYLLGSVYVREAQIVLANALRSSLLRLQAVGRGIGQNFKSAAALVRTMVAAKESARKLQESANTQTRAIDPGDQTNPGDGSNGVLGAKSEEQLRSEVERQKAEAEKVMLEVAENALPLVYDTVWTLNTQEITNLTAKVVRGVLSNIGNEERKKRAVAIYELGRIFRSFKDDRQKTSGPSAATLMADIERAMMHVMQGGEDQT